LNYAYDLPFPILNAIISLYAVNLTNKSQAYHRMHIPPEVWGPFFWHTIHIVALGYPTEPSYSHKKSAKEFYESLRNLIPCPMCRDHYNKHLDKYPITTHLDRRSDLFKWTVLLHNEVNKSLGKPEYTESRIMKDYARLGSIKRSPIWTPDDFAEADWKARVQGIALGMGVTGVGVLTVWMMNN
jgi:hypothetical protein